MRKVFGVVAELGDIVELILERERIAVLSHVDADGDSLGSSVALQRALGQMGKKAFIPAPLDFPPRYSFLRKYANGWGAPVEPDLLVVLDCSRPHRIDWGGLTRPEGVPMINIDHHDDNSRFGDLNWVDPGAAAVGQMVYSLLRALGAPIDERTASALYVALMTDTGRFSFGNTTADALSVAAELVRLGADPKFLTTEVYFNFSEEYVRNIGIALFNSKSFFGGRVLFLTLDRATTRNFATSMDEAEGIIDFAMAVRCVDVAALFRELAPRRISVSLRSRRGIDISQVARFFGGGGHPNAAGCTIKESLAAAQQAVLLQVKRLLGLERKTD